MVDTVCKLHGAELIVNELHISHDFEHLCYSLQSQDLLFSLIHYNYKYYSRPLFSADLISVDWNLHGFSLPFFLGNYYCVEGIKH